MTDNRVKKSAIALAVLLVALFVLSQACGVFTVRGERQVVADEEPTAVPEEEPTAAPTPTPEPSNTLGTLTSTDAATIGATLISPAGGTGQYLLDQNDNVTRIWTGTGNALSAQLLPNGMLLRTVDTANIDAAGATGTIQLASSEGNAWTCTLNQSWFGGLHLQGSAQWLPPSQDRGTAPWGSLLLQAYLVQSETQLARIGFDMPAGTDRVFIDALIEVVPNVDAVGTLADMGGTYSDGECGTTIWEWHSRDRLADDAADVPGPSGPDWTRFSAVALNEELGMIAAASPGLGEVWIIDRQLGTGASASPSGALLARWQEADQPTGVAWDDTTLLVAADAVVKVDLITGDSTEVAALTDTAAQVDTLDNGNIVVTEPALGRVIELDPSGTVVWEFVSPIRPAPAPDADDEILALDAEIDQGASPVAVVRRYPAEYPGLN